MPADDPKLLYWVDRLFGLPTADVAEAVGLVRSLKIRHLSEELVERSTVDSAIGCYLLSRSLDVLGQHLPETKLLKKLRGDPDVWPTWSELRTAMLLVEWAPEGTTVEMDAGRAAGAQPDLRVVAPDDPGAQSIEIKSIGLSDEEVAFCSRMAAALPRFAPKDGFANVHALIGDPQPQVPRAARRSHGRGTGKQIRSMLPGWPPGVSGASVVLHGADDDYMRRVALRVRDAVRQLPADDECWVAFHWTHGASMRRILEFIRWDEVPGHVAGLVFAGSATLFPDRQLHAFQYFIGRGSGWGDELPFESRDASEAGRRIGDLIHTMIQTSSGVRATLLRAETVGGGRRTLAYRDGSRRLTPFNLMLDVDSSEAQEAMRQRLASGRR